MLLTSVLPTALVAALSSSEHPSFLFILGDDIGWADFSYNNGTAHTPRVKEWTETSGTLTMQDFHSGGTVCSPTRATILTGRNHYRDCVNMVYEMSDPIYGAPHFEFAPQGTYTIGNAVRDANLGYSSWFGGKWHLGSFYNDSEKYGGLTSNPITHGFDHFHATIEVAPTSTTNCMCKPEWHDSCIFGHDKKPTHCLPGKCCFNYWWNANTEHGVTNLTSETPPDDSAYLAAKLIEFINTSVAKQAPFLAQASFHNCHIPYMASSDELRELCQNGTTCKLPDEGAAPFDETELDFYTCLNEFDSAVGSVLDYLKSVDYYENTLIWFTTDNGPEMNCKPEGNCKGTIHRPIANSPGPGSAGPLRGRKRDIWEGGHRVPGIISWPKVVGDRKGEVWTTVWTMDFLPTIMDVLGVKRPESQANWAFDGKSLLPLLKGGDLEERDFGWWYYSRVPSKKNGYGYRHGKWKLVAGSASCTIPKCQQPQLYDLSVDLGEENDLSQQHPDILKQLEDGFAAFAASVSRSIHEESKCRTNGAVEDLHPFPSEISETSTSCGSCVESGAGSLLSSIAEGYTSTRDECCAACTALEACTGIVYRAASAMRPAFNGETTGGDCHLKGGGEFEIVADGFPQSMSACSRV